MRILFDECVDFAVCEFLRQKGFDAAHVKETTRRGISNGELYELAQIDFQMLISTDRVFRNPRKYPPTAALGIIFIRIRPPRAAVIIPAFERFLKGVPIESVVGKHTTIRREDFTVQ